MAFGDTGSGKSEFLRTYLHGLTESSTPEATRVLLIDYRRTLLGSVPDEFLAAYAADSTFAAGCIAQVVAKLRERMPPTSVTQRELAARSWWTGPEIYVVADDYDLVSAPQGPLSTLAEFIPHARDIGLHIVLARRVSGSSRISYSDPVLNRMRELGTVGLIFSGDPREGVVIASEKAAQRPRGRAMLVRRGVANSLVQVAVIHEQDEHTASVVAPR
jgi:S-DNA-T family DNA segregation ATPase FtsK/SpoIIIE